MKEIRVVPIELETGYQIETGVKSFVVFGKDGTYLVDTGSHLGAKSQEFKGLLTQAGVGDLDMILITHCHSDHAGNAALVKDWYPRAKLAISPLGAKRLALGDWSKHQDSARRDFFKIFGNPRAEGQPTFAWSNLPNRPTTLPAQADLLLGSGPWGEWSIYPTPGHAADHLCLGIGEHFFGGDLVLSFLPGLEEIWNGDFNGLQEYLDSGKLLAAQSPRYRQIHAFHGTNLASLEHWYHQIILPRVKRKAEQLLKHLSPTSPLRLKDLMALALPKQPEEHYIYMTQLQALLSFWEAQGQACKQTDDSGAWGWTCPDPKAALLALQQAF